MPRRPEHHEQVALVAWARHAAATGRLAPPDGTVLPLTPGQVLALSLLHAIPNGGARGKAEAGRLKAEGVLAGIPDLFLPYPVATPTGRLAGLYVEMKAPRAPGQPAGRVQPHQRAMLADLRSLGYAAVVAHGYDEARAAIVDHLRADVAHLAADLGSHVSTDRPLIAR